MMLRGELTVVHQEPHGLVTTIPPLQSSVGTIVAVLLVDKCTSHTPSSAVDVLVITPASKVHIPFMKFELHVTSCVCEVPANGEAARVSMLSDGWDVQELAAVILDSGQKDQSELIGVLVNLRDDVGSCHDVAVIRLDKQHVLLGIEAVPLDLRFDGILEGC